MESELRSKLMALGALMAFVGGGAQASTTVTVVGSADPILAGQPAGYNCCGGDTAPGQSPLLVPGTLTAGSTLTFSATGGVDFGGGASSNADGIGGYFVNLPDAGGGIAPALNVLADGLVGVFLGPSAPASASQPSKLDFGSAGLGLDFAGLSPGLNQVFWVGDGLTGTGSGAVQTFIVPTGATRLFLGTVDGSGWSNNSGSYSVTINGMGAATAGVPEPGTWALMLMGVAGLGGVLRSRRKAQPGALAA